MNLQGKINLIKAAKDAIKSAIISMGVIPSGNISTYADAITQIDTVNNTSLTVSPSTTSQTLRPSSEYTGYGVVNVNPVTASIDSDITANNIKTGVEILGVTGEVDELIGQTKTVTENGVYTPDDGYTGFTSVTVDTPPAIRREVKNGVYQMPTSSFTFSIPDEATSLGADAMYYAFNNCTGLTSVDLSSLTTINGGNVINNGFYNCRNLTSVNLSSLTTIVGNYVLEYAFYNCTGLTSVDLSSLTTINGNAIMSHCFQNCTSLTSIDLSNLTTINNNENYYDIMWQYFYNCTSLTSVDLSSLTIADNYECFESAFYNCTSLTSVDLSSLTIIGDRAFRQAFWGCTQLTSVDLSSLTTIKDLGLYQAFRKCINLTTLSFPSLKSSTFNSNTNQLTGLLTQVTGCTVHFPSNLQSVIGSWSDVVSGFGGTNTTILFDLPATT